MDQLAPTATRPAVVKRILLGRPLATSEQEHQRLPKVIALSTFSSDAISSTAYATEEILFVIAVGGSSLALGLSKLVPISIAVAILLTIVVLSYRQTIFAYPSGGGSYIVSRENLGEYPSLVAGASLLVDYVLTVAVSISAGVAAIISLPAFRGLADSRVALCLGLIGLLTVANLRGLKESGRIFAVPTYIYIVSLSALLVVGLLRSFFGDLDPVPFDPESAEHIRDAGGTLGLFLILRGFSSGAVALTGVEAISNGVPAFRRPESRNAATTMTMMGVLLGSLFVGVSVLAHHLHPFPSHDETVISQMGRAVFGSENPIYVVLQFATAGILVLAANTAYADFPRLTSIISRDGYLPRQFANRGDRLVFSNGILFLASASAGLIVAFGGITNALIPLYAVGVFTSFTLSQAGMVIHHRRLREEGWRRGLVINVAGASVTFLVLLIVGITKFAVGAWLPIVVIPLIITFFKGVKRHYGRVSAALAVPPGWRPPRTNQTMVVLVGSVHRGVLEALSYARAYNPDHLLAVSIVTDGEEQERLEHQWEEHGLEVPLEFVHSPYRELTKPVLRFLDKLDQRWENDTVTVLIPEFIVTRWWEQIFHNQSALMLKGRLLFRPRTVVTSIPYHVDRDTVTMPVG
ncbi:MAG TPA: APC family permease [Acidimicrobiia bacterium]|nr:APC family permease [Acidimicrobiia bacterium]